MTQRPTMFIIFWKGWGLLAVAALIHPVLAGVALIDPYPALALPAAGLALFACGLACWVYGRRWNRIVTGHSLYSVPLQYSGALEGVAGVAVAALEVAGALIGKE
jgi:hypothetical protein